MGAFVTAYLVVWLAVVLYVVRLGARQRRLHRTLEALQRRFDRPDREETSTSRAA